MSKMIFARNPRLWLRKGPVLPTGKMSAPAQALAASSSQSCSREGAGFNFKVSTRFPTGAVALSLPAS